MSHSKRIVLAIETSCDETAVAIVDSHKKIHAQHIFSQIQQHLPFGGVVPEIAARAHLERLPILVQKTLQDAQLSFSEIHGIAATTGPGLIGGILVGMSYAKALAFALSKPFFSINHLAGHALSARLTESIAFPYLLLLISGGHSQFIVLKSPFHYVELGHTRDDAVGETFDKTAKLLGLPYPGGPELEHIAKMGNPHAYRLPKPLYKDASCDLSFSGLKTAVRELIQEHTYTESMRADIAASFQFTICEALIERTSRALAHARTHTSIDQFVMAGGVAANQYLRQTMTEALQKKGVQCIVPPIQLCTDNAAMIGWAALEMWDQYAYSNNYASQARPRWPLHELNLEVPK